MWSLATSVKNLAEAQVEVNQVLQEELKSIWVMSRGCEDMLWDMSTEVSNCATMLELFM